MANEAQVRSSLSIRKGNLVYNGLPSGFAADVATANPKGPTPGSVTVTTSGTDIALSQLTAMGGLCRITNLDRTNFVSYGVYAPDVTEWIAVHEILPGESYVVRLSRKLGFEYSPPGTGSTGSGIALRFVADTASCIVLVEAFDP